MFLFDSARLGLCEHARDLGKAKLVGVL